MPKVSQHIAAYGYASPICLGFWGRVSGVPRLAACQGRRLRSVYLFNLFVKSSVSASAGISSRKGLLPALFSGLSLPHFSSMSSPQFQSFCDHVVQLGRRFVPVPRLPDDVCKFWIREISFVSFVQGKITTDAKVAVETQNSPGPVAHTCLVIVRPSNPTTQRLSATPCSHQQLVESLIRAGDRVASPTRAYNPL